MISVSEIELEAIVEKYDNAKKTAVAGVSVIIHNQREEVRKSEKPRVDHVHVQ